MSGTDEDRDLRWAAWRVEEDGSVRAMLVFAEAGEIAREEVRYETLAEAGEQLGASFREVVQRAVAEGHRQGRWRP